MQGKAAAAAAAAKNQPANELSKSNFRAYGVLVCVRASQPASCSPRHCDAGQPCDYSVMMDLYPGTKEHGAVLDQFFTVFDTSNNGSVNFSVRFLCARSRCVHCSRATTTMADTAAALLVLRSSYWGSPSWHTARFKTRLNCSSR